MPRSKEIPEDLRKKVIETYQAGNGYKNIAKILSIPKTTVRGIVCKWKRFGTIMTLPRSGRPPKISPKGREIIIQEVMNNPCTTPRKLQATLASANIHVHDSTIRKVIIMHARPSLTCFGSSIDKTTLCQEDSLNKEIKVESDEQVIDCNNEMSDCYDIEGCSGNDKNVKSDVTGGDDDDDGKSGRSDNDVIDEDDDDGSGGGSHIKGSSGTGVVTDNRICDDKNNWSDCDVSDDNDCEGKKVWSGHDDDLRDNDGSDDDKCSDGDKMKDNSIDEENERSDCIDDPTNNDDDSNDDNVVADTLATVRNERSDENYDNCESDDDSQMSDHKSDGGSEKHGSNHNVISDHDGESNEEQKRVVDNVENVGGDFQIHKTRHSGSRRNNNSGGGEKHHGASNDGNWNCSDGFDLSSSTEFEANAFDYNAENWSDWGWM